MPGMSTGAHSSMPLPRRVTVRRRARRGSTAEIAHPRIQKSGLALVGHFEGISPDRVQILGQTEMTFLAAMSPEPRAERVDGFSRGASAAWS
jgi:serine kinase of HPr protein (carbohydrate metabolism regulator)